MEGVGQGSLGQGTGQTSPRPGALHHKHPVGSGQCLEPPSLSPRAEGHLLTMWGCTQFENIPTSRQNIPLPLFSMGLEASAVPALGG